MCLIFKEQKKLQQLKVSKTETGGTEQDLFKFVFEPLLLNTYNVA